MTSLFVTAILSLQEPIYGGWHNPSYSRWMMKVRIHSHKEALSSWFPPVLVSRRGTGKQGHRNWAESFLQPVSQEMLRKTPDLTLGTKLPFPGTAEHGIILQCSQFLFGKSCAGTVTRKGLSCMGGVRASTNIRNKHVTDGINSETWKECSNASLILVLNTT